MASQYLPLWVVLVFCGEIDSADSVSIATAVLEANLTYRPRISVAYQNDVDYPKAIKLPKGVILSMLCRWDLDESCESFCESAREMPSEIINQYWYSEGITDEWYFAGKPSALREIVKINGPPNRYWRADNPLALAMGYATFGADDGVLGFLKAAQHAKALTARAVDGQLEIKLPRTTGEQTALMTITLDPTHDYRITRWTVGLGAAAGEKNRAFSVHIEEYQQLDLGNPGQTLWFPIRVKVDWPGMTYRVTVQNLAAGSKLANVTKILHPLGTPVTDRTGPAGAQPITSLFGVEAAHRKRLDQIGQQVRTEMNEHTHGGVIHTANVPRSYTSRYLALFGILAFSAAVIVYRIRCGK
jgi:hypothetical protein